MKCNVRWKALNYSFSVAKWIVSALTKSIWHHGGQVSGVIAIPCEVLKVKSEYSKNGVENTAESNLILCKSIFPGMLCWVLLSLPQQRYKQEEEGFKTGSVTPWTLVELIITSRKWMTSGKWMMKTSTITANKTPSQLSQGWKPSKELSGPTRVLFKGHKQFSPAAFSSLGAPPAGRICPISVKQAQELRPS